jgi:hypothetical protein
MMQKSGGRGQGIINLKKMVVNNEKQYPEYT